MKLWWVNLKRKRRFPRERMLLMILPAFLNSVSLYIGVWIPIVKPNFSGKIGQNRTNQRRVSTRTAAPER